MARKTGNSQNRCRDLTAEDIRELFPTDKEEDRLNRQHDLELVDIRRLAGYEPASPRKDRKSIWRWHRKMEASRTEGFSTPISSFQATIH